MAIFRRSRVLVSCAPLSLDTLPVPSEPRSLLRYLSREAVLLYDEKIKVLGTTGGVRIRCQQNASIVRVGARSESAPPAEIKFGWSLYRGSAATSTNAEKRRAYCIMHPWIGRSEPRRRYMSIQTKSDSRCECQLNYLPRWKLLHQSATSPGTFCTSSNCPARLVRIVHLSLLQQTRLLARG